MVYFTLQLGYFLRDVVFFLSLLLVPLALGFVVSPFGKEKGIELLFGSIGIALWPLGWLFIDAIVLLALSPLDNLLTAPFSATAGIGVGLLVGGTGLSKLVTFAFYALLLTLVVMAGYVQMAIFIQKIMSGISGMVLRFGVRNGGNPASAITNAGRNVITAARTAGGDATAAAGAVSTAAVSRFGGRRASPAGAASAVASSAVRGNRPKK